MYTVVTSEISGPGVCYFKFYYCFSEYILLFKELISSKEVTMAGWERSAIVTVWFRVRIRLVSLVWFEIFEILKCQVA